LEVYQMGREEGSGVREALGEDRREPRILCWNCKHLTPFHEDRCTNCGAKFAGSTGGVYSEPAKPTKRVPSPRDELAEARRSLMKLFEDLQRVHDVSSRHSGAVRDHEGSDGHGTLGLFQCPSCGRFVAESAEDCACGVRFASAPTLFSCPECGSHFSTPEDACPVCDTRFAPEEEIVYQCPRCGAHVDAAASRCACGARFAD
jgi:hypothetical protein